MACFFYKIKFNIMKKNILIALFAVSSLTYAQDNKSELIANTGKVETGKAEGEDGWKKGGVFNLNFSNVGLQNWAAGGANSYSFTALTGLYANLVKGNSTWDNNLDLGLGSIQQFAPGTPSDDRQWVKSDDKIDFTSKYGQKATEDWYYSGLVNFKSQFLDGFDDPYALAADRNIISRMFAPAYALAAIGMDYKPNKEFSMFIAPITSKITIVADKDLNAVGAFGVEDGEAIRTEIGVYIRLLYSKDIAKNVNFTTKYETFMNYKQAGHFDVNWETLTSMKVNEYISATFTTNLIYDDDILIGVDENDDGVILGNDETHARIQFKHVLGVGLTYKF